MRSSYLLLLLLIGCQEKEVIRNPRVIWSYNGVLRIETPDGLIDVISDTYTIELTIYRKNGKVVKRTVREL